VTFFGVSAVQFDFSIFFSRSYGEIGNLLESVFRGGGIFVIDWLPSLVILTIHIGTRSFGLESRGQSGSQTHY
jgi:hypothetical protein